VPILEFIVFKYTRVSQYMGSAIAHFWTHPTKSHCSRAIWQMVGVLAELGDFCITPRKGSIQIISIFARDPLMEALSDPYIGTGNNYNVPQTVKDCISKLSSQTPSDELQCLDSNDYIDAIMALDLDTGAIKWSKKLQGYDTWTIACLTGSAVNCPDPKGPDYDFGQAPMLFSVKNAGKQRDLVGAGQKSGVFWALDRDTGNVVWSQIVGPGGTLGGIQWGSATDGGEIYVAISNSEFQEYKLEPSGETTSGGSWSALDPATGKIIWQTADPAGGSDMAPLTVANGVVYAGSMASGSDKNNMYALDAKTGKILWGFNSGGSVVAGPAVVDGTVYWGSGYGQYNIGVSNNQFYAFTLKYNTRE